MVSHKKGNPVDLCICQFSVMQKFSHHLDSFNFLVFSIGISIFIATKRAGNIMCDCSSFKNKHGFMIQSFQFTYRLRVCPHTNQMVNVMDIPV